MMYGYKVKFQHVIGVSFGDFFQQMEGHRTMMGQYPEIGVFHLFAQGSADYKCSKQHTKNQWSSQTALVVSVC